MMNKIDSGWRRILAILLFLILLCECSLNQYLRPAYEHHGAVVSAIQPQLEEVWGAEYEDEPIGEVLLPGGPAVVRETLAFSAEPVPASSLPKLWLGAAALLTTASFFLPGSTVLWISAVLCSLAGTVALPLLVPPTIDTASYCCTVRVDRYIDGSDSPDHKASMAVTYAAYENLSVSDVDPPRIDWDSAQTSWDTSEEAFAALAPS